MFFFQDKKIRLSKRGAYRLERRGNIHERRLTAKVGLKKEINDWKTSNPGYESSNFVFASPYFFPYVSFSWDCMYGLMITALCRLLLLLWVFSFTLIML